jgi:hypothetical protein
LLVLAGSGGIEAGLQARAQGLAGRHGDILRAHVLPTVPELQRRYGVGAESKLYLIRPDGYVGFRCLASELPRLQEFLQSLVDGPAA